VPRRYGGGVLAVYAFGAWTVFVWVTRVRNIVEDQGSNLDLVVALVLATLGVAVVVAARKGGLAPVLAAAVVATVAVWALRTPLIVLDADHGVAFKAVHSALAVISVVLGLAAWRTTGFWPALRHGRQPSQAKTAT
jgi:hypothetical protein